MAVAGAVAGIAELVELLAETTAITAEMTANIAATEAAVSSIAVAETSLVGAETAAAASTAAVLEVSGGTVETAAAVADTIAATAEASEAITLAATSSSILGMGMGVGETALTGTGLAETSFIPLAASTPFAVGGAQAITPGVILPFTLDVTGEITGGAAVAGTTSFLAANAAILAGSTSFLAASATGATVGAVLLSSSVAGTGAAAAAASAASVASAVSTTATASSSTAVVSGIVAGWIGKGVFTAISVAGLGQGVYKAIQKLEQYLPGSSDALLQNIESGKLNKENVMTWLQLLDNKFNILASLKNSGSYVISDKDGNLVKVGSALFKVLQSKNLSLDKDNVLEKIKQSNMVKNLNSDIITNMWQAISTY